MSQRIYMSYRYVMYSMLWISFFRPKECFRGAFNNLAAWWTNGAFCHCELVVEGSSDFILTHVQQTYVKHMKNKDQRSKEIVQELERAVLNKYARRLIHKHNRGWLSFSLLFGDKLRIRVLDPESSEAWQQTPQQRNDLIAWKSINLVEDALEHVYKWALEETGKPYDNAGALFSWMPSIFHEDVNPKKHFCSEFCTRALQRTGHLTRLKASHTTPNHLYDALQKMVQPITNDVGLDVEKLIVEEAKHDFASLEAMMEDSSDEAMMEDSSDEEVDPHVDVSVDPHVDVSVDTSPTSEHTPTKCPLPSVSPPVQTSSDESKVYNTTCQPPAAPAPLENTDPAPANT